MKEAPKRKEVPKEESKEESKDGSKEGSKEAPKICTFFLLWKTTPRGGGEKNDTFLVFGKRFYVFGIRIAAAFFRVFLFF